MERVKLTHLDKFYWDKITKGDLIAYYRAVAPRLLPLLKDRPLVMRRYPDGIKGESFFQKEAGHPPSFVKTVKIQHEERTISYILVQNLSTLLYVVNLGSIELHPFHNRYKRPHNPDYVILDLDPEKISFDAVVETAQTIHEILEEKKIKSHCKTSGGRGLHIMIPWKKDYEEAKEFAHNIAIEANNRLPAITSLERLPQKRQKKVYIDFLQNRPMQTIVAAYSVRGRPGAPISMPLSWDQVMPGLDPSQFTIQTVLTQQQSLKTSKKP